MDCMDLFVANDTVQNFLFINRGKDKKTGKWTWEESALGSEVGYSENGQARSGMGVDAADVFKSQAIRISSWRMSIRRCSRFIAT